MNAGSRTRLSAYILLIWLCCSGFGQRKTSQSANENAIREAVLREEMLGWARGGDESERRAKTAIEKAIAKEMNFTVFFISINERNPEPVLITHLQDVPRIIKKVSDSKIDNRVRLGAVVDKDTGQRGIIFRADEIRWLNSDSAEIDGGYFCDGLCGITETYRVQRTRGKWKVTGRTVHRIS